MAIAGQIEYKVTVDTSGLKSGLDKAKGEAGKFSSALGNAGKTGAKLLSGAIKAGAIASTGAIVGLVKGATSSFADYEQLVGGVETLFKDSADKVMEYAQGAYKTAGLSANEYMEQATSFSARLIRETGGDTAKTAELINMAITDMSDNANKMGTDIGLIQNAYEGLSKGNATMLDNLKVGYGGTQTEMLKLAKDMGVIDQNVNSFNDVSFEDAILAIHKVQGELDITGTTSKEATETISGSFNTMKSSWSNLLTALAGGGGDVDKMIGEFIDSFSTFGKNVLPVMKTALKGVVRLITELAPEIIGMLPSLVAELLPAVIEATTTLIQAIVDNLPAILQVLLDSLPILINGLLQIAQGLLQALPQLLVFLYQLIIGIAKALVEPQNLQLILKAGLTLLIELVKAIPQITEMFYTALPTLIDSIVGFLTDPSSIKMIIKAGVQLFMGLVKAVPQILGALFSAFGTLIGNLWNRLTGLFKAFAGKFGDTIGGVFKGAINRVLEFIEGFINAPIDIINGFVDTINGAFGSVGVNIGKIGRINLGRMASGGIVPSTAGGRLILAGEGGQDEWVVPESKMASMIEQINERTGGTGTGGITINVYGTFATSEAEQRRVAEQIYSKLQEINKARMGAYL